MTEEWGQKEYQSLWDAYLSIHELVIDQQKKGNLSSRACFKVLAAFSHAVPGGLRHSSADISGTNILRNGIAMMVKELLVQCPGQAAEIRSRTASL